MGIGAVSGSSYTPPAGSAAEIKIKALDARITDLQKKLQEVRDNKKLDEKTKSMQIQLYQKQIAELQAQKAELRSQASKPKQQNAQSRETEKSAQSAQEEAEVEMQKGFAQLGTAKETSQTLSRARSGVENELRLADSKAYSLSPKADPGKVAKARAKLVGIDSRMANVAKNASASIEKAEELEEQAKSLTEQEEEKLEQNGHSGTGRMEPGQFLDEEA